MVDQDSPIEEVLTMYPQVTGLLVRLRMMCAGCDIARFHTVEDVATAYNLDTQTFLSDIRMLAESVAQTDPNGAHG